MYSWCWYLNLNNFFAYFFDKHVKIVLPFTIFYRDYRELQVAEYTNLSHNNEKLNVKHDY